MRLPSCEQIGEAVTFNDEIFCLTPSPDASQVILVTAANVFRLSISPSANVEQQKWQTQSRSLSRHSPEGVQLTVQSAKCGFSPDGTRAVLAIRSRPAGRVMVSVFSTKGRSIKCLEHRNLGELRLV